MAALLLIPFFLLRFGLLSALDRGALPRAAHFPPRRGGEGAAYVLHQLSTAALLVIPFFSEVHLTPLWRFGTGAALYIAGLAWLAMAVWAFAAPDGDGVCRRGVYRWSRNPMYLAYFVYFLGYSLLTASWAMGAALALFQLSAHRLILAEERWCLAQFGAPYAAYLQKVRRYL